MGKGTNTTTSSSQPPPQVMAAYQDLMNRAQGVASTPYQPYLGPNMAYRQPGQPGQIMSQPDAGTGSPPTTGTPSNFSPTGSPWDVFAQFAPSANSPSGGLTSAPQGGAQPNVPPGTTYGDLAGGLVAGPNQYTFDAMGQALAQAQIPGSYNTASNVAAQGVGNYANSAANYGVNSGNTVGQFGVNSGQNVATYGTNAGLGIGAYGTGAGQGISNFARGISASGPQFAGIGDIGNYLSPYNQNVIDTTTANINRQNDLQQQGVIGNAIRSGNAFGGDRMGLAMSELARNQDLAKNQTIAGLENQNYSQALGQLNTTNAQALAGRQAALSGQEAGAGLGLGALTSGSQLGLGAMGTGSQLGLGALEGGSQLGLTGQNLGLSGSATQAGLYGSLGQIAQNENLASQGSLYNAGNVQQANEQNQLNAAYQQFMQAQGYPFQSTGWLGSTLGLSAAGMGGTSTTTGPAPNQGAQFLGAGLAGLALIPKIKRGGRVQGYAMGGMPYGGASSYVPTAQAIMGGLGVPKAPVLSNQQAPDLVGALSKGLGPALKGLNSLGSVPLDITAPDLSVDSGTLGGMGAGLGGIYRRGGLVPHYADGGYTPDFDQSFDDVQQPAYNGLTADALLASQGLTGGQPIVPLPQPRPQIPGDAAPAMAPPMDIAPSPQVAGLSGDAALPPNAMPTAYSPSGSRADTQRMIAEEAVRQGVPPELALRVARQESGFNPNVQDSSAGAIGPMQLMPGTAKDLGVDPRDPAQNIRGGVSYLKQMLALHGGDVPLALASYNAGPGRVQQYLAGKSGLPSETQNYVASITGQGMGANTPGATGPAQTQVAQAGLGSTPQPAEYNGPQSLFEKGGLDAFLSSPRAALFYAGLGMMASRSPNLGNAIGEGALSGLSTYAAAKRMSQQAEMTRAQMQRQDLQLQERTSHDRAQEGYWKTLSDRGRFTFQPGTGIDPETGNQVPGMYRLPTMTSDPNVKPEFFPGQTLTGRTSRTMTPIEIDKEARMRAAMEVGKADDPQWMGKQPQFRQTLQDAIIRHQQELRSRYGITSPGGSTPQLKQGAPAAAPSGNQGELKPAPNDLMDSAKAAIAKGAPRDAVIKRLRDNGYDASGL